MKQDRDRHLSRAVLVLGFGVSDGRCSPTLKPYRDRNIREDTYWWNSSEVPSVFRLENENGSTALMQAFVTWFAAGSIVLNTTDVWPWKRECCAD